MQEHGLRQLIVSTTGPHPRYYSILTAVDRIWTHNIRGIEFHEDFQPESCSLDNGGEPQMAATIAAAETDTDVYKALDGHGAVVVGGSNPVRKCSQPYLPLSETNLYPL